MPSSNFIDYISTETQALTQSGLYKTERIIRSPQQAVITLEDGSEVINFCANNYLGLANDSALIDAAHAGLDQYGFGVASVRFICGTQQVHKQLEDTISSFLHLQDTILYSSCFDANAGLFETLLSKEDAVISDALNHASIIDGVRLCKAQRFRYANNDMRDLEEKLRQAQDARFRLIITDGVFSMDGVIANLPEICNLAERYDALVAVDDSHAMGFMGPGGRGTPEFHGVMDRVDIITGTLGKALGGASGGFTSSHKPIIDWLRQRSRPYLFSNSLAPMIANASIKAFQLLQSSNDLREKLHVNSRYFREHMQALGFKLTPGEHAIIPVMLGDAKLASTMADELLKLGIYVIGFSYPVVPKDQARIRTQMSASHEKAHLDKAIEAFATVGKKLNLI